jgi:hypothetical protein
LIDGTEELKITSTIINAAGFSVNKFVVNQALICFYHMRIRKEVGDDSNQQFHGDF